MRLWKGRWLVSPCSVLIWDFSNIWQFNFPLKEAPKYSGQFLWWHSVCRQSGKSLVPLKIEQYATAAPPAQYIHHLKHCHCVIVCHWGWGRESTVIYWKRDKCELRICTIPQTTLTSQNVNLRSYRDMSRGELFFQTPFWELKTATQPGEAIYQSLAKSWTIR